MNPQNVDIVFCGEDGFSAVVLKSIIEAGHNVKGVIIPEYTNMAYLKLARLCKDNDIPYVRSKNINSKEVTDWVAQLQPQIGISAHFTKIIKKKLLSLPSLGFINLHPSPLPYYRGATPQHWQIANGETSSAVTVHYINEGIDTGDIVVQEKFDIAFTDYVADLQKKWLKIYPEIITRAIDKVIAGEKPIRQPDIKTHYYGILKPEEMVLTDEMSVVEIYNRVRAFSLPYSGAQYGDVRIFNGEIVDEFIQDISEMPLGICCDNEGRMFLKCKDGVLRVLKYVRDETSRISSSKDIINLRQEVRQQDGSVVTNFNSFPSDLQKWIDRKEVSLLSIPKNQNGGSKWLIYRNKNHNELFFFSKDYESVAENIEIIVSQLYNPSIIEIVTKDVHSPLDVDPLMILNRMSCTSITIPSLEKNYNVESSSYTDVEEINKILTSVFNPVAERIPSLEELMEFIDDPEKGGILIVKDMGVIIGILIYSMNATTIHLRHFWTDCHHRGKGVGSSLMNEYLKKASRCKRMILWVKTDNDNAIGVYKHFLFTEEKLYDYIYQVN